MKPRTYPELRIRGISDKTKAELKAIARFRGQNFSRFLIAELQRIAKTHEVSQARGAA